MKRYRMKSQHDFDKFSHEIAYNASYGETTKKPRQGRRSIDIVKKADVKH